MRKLFVWNLLIGRWFWLVKMLSNCISPSTTVISIAAETKVLEIEPIRNFEPASMGKFWSTSRSPKICESATVMNNTDAEAASAAIGRIFSIEAIAGREEEKVGVVVDFRGTFWNGAGRVG